MGKRKKPLNKTINPTYYVFCEGETEEEYIKLLKRHYRLPIEIKPKVEGNKISERKIKEYLKSKQVSEKDLTFLLYDIDAPKMLEKLQEIKGAILLASNPCIELWFLLHYKEHKANINTDDCVSALIDNYWKNYKKGYIEEKHKTDLTNNIADAVSKAKALKHHHNPSTTVYFLIEKLEEVKRGKE